MNKLTNSLEMLDYILQEANPFAVLGLNFCAGENEIKRAYHQIKRVVHPDCFLEPEVKEKAQRAFVRLGKIFEELIDAHLRKQWQNKLCEIQSLSLQTHTNKKSQSALEWALTFFQEGQKYVFQNQWDKAISAFQKAIRIAPQAPDFYCYLGLSLHSKGKIGEAQNALYAALRLDPYHPLSMHYLERIQVDLQLRQQNHQERKTFSYPRDNAFLLIQKAVSCNR